MEDIDIIAIQNFLLESTTLESRLISAAQSFGNALRLDKMKCFITSNQEPEVQDNLKNYLELACRDFIKHHEV